MQLEYLFNIYIHQPPTLIIKWDLKCRKITGFNIPSLTTQLSINWASRSDIYSSHSRHCHQPIKEVGQLKAHNTAANQLRRYASQRLFLPHDISTKSLLTKLAALSQVDSCKYNLNTTTTSVANENDDLHRQK